MKGQKFERKNIFNRRVLYRWSSISWYRSKKKYSKTENRLCNFKDKKSKIMKSGTKYSQSARRLQSDQANSHQYFIQYNRFGHAQHDQKDYIL